jgi:hypothetical protein
MGPNELSPVEEASVHAAELAEKYADKQSHPNL